MKMNEDLKKLTIRPHHLLCMQGYQGKGYSEDFVSNMDKVVNFLRSEPNAEVKLLTDCDDICSACPNCKKINGKYECVSEKSHFTNELKIIREREILDFLNLKDGGFYKVSEVFDLVNRKINTKSCADRLYCKDCVWQSVCLWYTSLSNLFYLGKNIDVVVDRMLGSKHPEFEWIYPINYGFVPNTISGDGESVDVYVLGVDKPLEKFKGKCIAVLHRLNDDDDKLIVVPVDCESLSRSDIEKQVEFQEQYFVHELFMS